MQKLPKPITRKCPYCKQRYQPKHLSTEPCPKYECRVAKLEKDKVIKKVVDAGNKKRFAELKEKVKKLSEYEAEAKRVFQHFIRLRDAWLPCISCNDPKPKDWCGGHYFAAGNYSGLIFDETNCHGQCNTNCNMYLGGNLIEYRHGLIRRYGIDYVNELEAKKDIGRNYKYTKFELIEIKNTYTDKIKQLKK
jgi:Bacteriophage Lambda NinG protein